MEMVPVHATLPQFEDYKYIEQHRTPHDAKKKQHWLKHREIAWDNTSRKYTPMMLRGYRPITLEPWADDSIRFGEERSLGFDVRSSNCPPIQLATCMSLTQMGFPFSLVACNSRGAQAEPPGRKKSQRCRRCCSTRR